MGQDLEVVEVGGANLEAPGGDVVVALDEHADFALARFQPGVKLARGNLEGGRHLFGHGLVIEAIPLAFLALGQAARLQVFGGATGDHLDRLAQDL